MQIVTPRVFSPSQRQPSRHPRLPDSWPRLAACWASSVIPQHVTVNTSHRTPTRVAGHSERMLDSSSRGRGSSQPSGATRQTRSEFSKSHRDFIRDIESALRSIYLGGIMMNLSHAAELGSWVLAPASNPDHTSSHDQRTSNRPISKTIPKSSLYWAGADAPPAFRIAEAPSR